MSTQNIKTARHFTPYMAICLVAILVIGIGVNIYVSKKYMIPKIAYVNTGKLMVGFAESNVVEKEIKTEDEKWQKQYKQLQDSLEATVKKMTKEYNDAPPAKKKEMQDMLSARNQEVNNFKQANIKKIQELRDNKMKGVVEKVNVYLAEYGKKHRYTIIFGTMAGGNIVYADERSIDITEDIIKGLNERYK